jgi:hypothetical protein
MQRIDGQLADCRYPDVDRDRAEPTGLERHAPGSNGHLRESGGTRLLRKRGLQLRADFPRPARQAWQLRCKRCLIPIRLGPVIRKQFGAPKVISHVRPVIFVEAGSALEQVLIDVQNELLFNRVEGESTPGDGK